MKVANQPSLFEELEAAPVGHKVHHHGLAEDLRSFSEFGQSTKVESTETFSPAGEQLRVATFVNEFWTSRQRAAHRLHEISYRGCFKPQLPRFFIRRLTKPGDAVYDPFMGRGTALLEAALMGRVPMGCDINALSVILIEPRLSPPTEKEVAERLRKIDFFRCKEIPRELLVFYHRDTLREIVSLKKYLLERESPSGIDRVDKWIRMVAVNRLTGHSSGFFSVYTLPPNQAVSIAAQRKINADRKQVPSRRNVPDLILRKTRQLLSDCDLVARENLRRTVRKAILLTRPSWDTSEIPTESVHLVVTSPPFLDVVDYAQDNWLRCWFCGIDPQQVAITATKKLVVWQEAMTRVFSELRRVLVHGGFVAFEVGEVRGGNLKLEEAVLPCGIEAGLTPQLILINDQEFTKTSHCWGVSNQKKGTNTNRVVVFEKL
jgi:hypothetical protein